MARALSRTRRDVVVLGASAGGVAALCTIFEGLGAQAELRVIAVLHRNRFRDGRLAEVFQRCSALPVIEPRDRDRFEPGRIYLAPRDQHLRVDADRFLLDRGAHEHFTRPAIDPTLRSVADRFGPRAVGVVLTGAGHDGLAGLIAIKAAGGLALVQDPEEAEQRSMPIHVIARDHPDAVVRLAALPALLKSLAKGAQLEPPTDLARHTLWP